MEIVQPARLGFRVSGAEEIDVRAILTRNPHTCVVDDLAHSNAPGSARFKRWEDVRVLLDAGINVLTTMNVQNLASLSDQIWQIAGVRVRETVPDWVFQQADEVVMVDVTPRALLHRLERGAIYGPESAPGDAAAVFREPTLVALRELAIRQTAQALEARHGYAPQHPDSRKEKILVHVTANPSTAMLLRRARRVTDYLGAHCVAVYVHSEREFSSLSQPERQAIERHLRFAENLHIETKIFYSRHRARGLVDYARENGCTQIFLNRDEKPHRRWFPGFEITDQVVERARDLEVTVGCRKEPGRAPAFGVSGRRGGRIDALRVTSASRPR